VVVPTQPGAREVLFLTFAIQAADCLLALLALCTD